MEATGQDVRKLQPDFEALGIDIVRMLDTASRLQAAVKNEKSDKGEYHEVLTILVFFFNCLCHGTYRME